MRLPMTESQKGLLVVDAGAPADSVLYNQLVRFDIDPALSDEAVSRALLTLVTIQPAMREVFAALPQMHASLTPPPVVLPMERVTVQPWEFEQALADVAQKIGRPTFDLARGPAYRFALVRASDRSAAAVLLADHHIILDGISLGPFVRDLEAALAKPLSREELAAKREAREIAFGKELAAQTRSASPERVAARAEEWAAQLREVPPLVISPRPGRPSYTSFSGARISWTMSKEEGKALTDLCRRLDVTPFVVFSGMYGLVLARHGNVGSVLIGSPFMARRTIGAFDLCGFFVNTLPVTVEAEWSRTVDEHLGKVVKGAVDHCRSNVDITFNQLVAHARPERSNNRNPLFSAMLAMQDTFSESTGSVLRMHELGNGNAKFDLWLGATPIDGHWQFELEYDRELISPATADGLLTSLRSAMRRALADSSVALSGLFTDWPVPRTDGWHRPIADGSFASIVEDVAAAQPDAVAIETPDRTFSYRELVASARRVANGLAAKGIGAGDVVGLVNQDLADTTIAILAILRRGAAYLPLDPTLPDERLAYMIEKAGCEFVIGRDADVSTLDGPDAALVESTEHPVYVMYTSGSTGKPKGVEMGHGPLANLTSWQLAALHMDSDTRFLQYAPLGFDVSFQEIIPTLVAGGTIVSREPADRRMFPAVLSRIASTQVTHVYLPVAALRPLVQLANARGVVLPHLRYLCVSGEQLMVDDEVRTFFERHQHCVLVNLYGPTETHAVTSHRLSYRNHEWAAHVPIGLPYPGVEAYVVDATGHLAPPGVVGELYLGGLCPATGYVNDPEITAQRFVADRFAGHGTMYRTGDLVVRDDDDVLTFLGRADDQVKIRGYRIELGEIETVANRCPSVHQAVAVVRGEGVDRELVLFVVPSGELDADAIKAEMSRSLPSYMVPMWVFELDTVPTTPTGKTDRDALVARSDELLVAPAEPEVVEYEDELERELAGIWAGVLNVEPIVRDRPVLEYGAHSLNIFTVLAEVQERYGVPVPMIDFFGSPTVATLAGLVRAGKAG
ncbi:non-ribosomal peptide synthetase [Lentzea guizhouensis]|uniref:Non-ribosomal peptide synthetase n=2 Tax=Lentzea guizhouensis TaxID=1586287 RepID=A0A1B2HMV2_9PSEU|nr:non-ribosomal peptide synthetase [Lentzea guizhouensis]